MDAIVDRSYYQLVLIVELHCSTWNYCGEAKTQNPGKVFSAIKILNLHYCSIQNFCSKHDATWRLLRPLTLALCITKETIVSMSRCISLSECTFLLVISLCIFNTGCFDVMSVA